MGLWMRKTRFVRVFISSELVFRRLDCLTLFMYGLTGRTLQALISVPPTSLPADLLAMLTAPSKKAIIVVLEEIDIFASTTRGGRQMLLYCLRKSVLEGGVYANVLIYFPPPSTS